jgi:hypothetical protein
LKKNDGSDRDQQDSDWLRSTSPLEAEGDAGEKAQKQQSNFVRIRGLSSMAAEYRVGDGINPREEKKRRLKEQWGAKSDHSTERLASQILSALNLSSLLSELGLDDFSFISVQPTQQSGCFLAELRCRDSSLAFDAKDVEQRLRSAKGRFRAEISEFVHRRKAPDLQFRILPAE